MLVTLLITFCSPAGDCHDYAPATYQSADYAALHECDALASDMPAEINARCIAAFAQED